MKTQLRNFLLTIFLFVSTSALHAQQWKLVGNNNTTATSKLGTTNAIDLNIFTNNVKRMTFKSGGNIGIGTATPLSNYGVHILGGVGDVQAQGLYIQRADANPSNQDCALGIGFSSNMFTGVGIGGGSCAFLLFPSVNTPAPDMAFSTNNVAPQMIIKFSGNVGINTSTPAEKLEVFGGDARIHTLTVGLGGGFVATNTALGTSALSSSSDAGTENTATGYQSLYSNIGSWNTATGAYSLMSNTYGASNTAIGYGTLRSNTSGGQNTAVGTLPLYNNTTGSNNSASGWASLYDNTTGNYNVGYGGASLFSNTTGGQNTAIGYNALYSNTTGSNNTTLGEGADVSAGNLTNATALGTGAIVDASNKVRVGNTAVTSIGGQVAWTNFSDARIKQNIKENVPGLEFINLLKPVTYNFNIDKENELMGIKSPTDEASKNAIEKINFTGFLAQDVDAAAQKVGYDFSGVDKSGNIMGLRYSEFVVPLVKSVQELSKQNDELKSQLAAMQSQIDALKNGSGSSIDSKVQTTNTSSVQLEQIAPNPFSQTATITFSLPSDVSNAQLIITDATGKTVMTYALSNGATQQVVSASGLTAGTYQYSLMINGKMIDSKQMVIVK